METQNIKRLLKALWIKSCRFDGIPADSKFVVFSDDNPYQRRYAKIMKMYLAGRNMFVVRSLNTNYYSF